MKKIFSMLSAAALVVVMAACGNKQAETVDTCCQDTVVAVDTCDVDTVAIDTVTPEVEEVKAQPAKPKAEQTEPAKTEPTRNSTVVKSENVKVGGAKAQVTEDVKNSMSTAVKNTKEVADKKAEEAEKAARNNWKESRNK